MHGVTVKLYKLVSGLFLLYECWCQYFKLRNI